MATLVIPNRLQPYTGTDQTDPIVKATSNAIAFQFWAKPVLQAQDGSYWCPGFEGPTYVQNEWGFMVIAGYPSTPPLEESKTPGLCEIRVSKYRDVDKKKKAGTDGARLTVHGIEPALVEIALTIWTPQQLYMLSRLWPVLFPPKDKIPKDAKGKLQYPMFDIDHPKLRLHDIKRLLFTGGEGPDPGPVPNARVFTMHAIEYMEPSKSVSTTSPVSAKSSLLDDAVTRKTPGQVEGNTDP